MLVDEVSGMQGHLAGCSDTDATVYTLNVVDRAMLVPSTESTPKKTPISGVSLDPLLPQGTHSSECVDAEQEDTFEGPRGLPCNVDSGTSPTHTQDAVALAMASASHLHGSAAYVNAVQTPAPDPTEAALWGDRYFESQVENKSG